MMEHMNDVYEVNGKVYVIDILNAYNYDWYIENAYGKWITAINPLSVYVAYWEVPFPEKSAKYWSNPCTSEGRLQDTEDFDVREFTYDKWRKEFVQDETEDIFKLLKVIPLIEPGHPDLFFTDLYNEDTWIETLEKAKKAAVLPFIDKYAESWKKTSEITRNTEPEEVAKLFMKECGYRKQA